MRWFIKYGKCIYTSPSGYKVYDSFIYRWLTLESTVLQTLINKLKPETPILYYIPAMSLMARAQPGDSCILGLGGAGLVHYLAPFSFSITAVEISQEVIDIARDYFMIDNRPNLQIVHQAAEEFLAKNDKPFNHLMVDLYDAHSFPSACKSSDFFLSCKKNIKPKGFLAVNLANAQEQHTIYKLIKVHFLHTFIIPMKKCANIVIIASNHDSKDEFLKIIQTKYELKKIGLDPYWGYVGDL